MNERVIKVPVKPDEMIYLHDTKLPWWRKSWFAFVGDAHPYFPTRAYRRKGLQAQVRRRLGAKFQDIDHMVEFRSAPESKTHKDHLLDAE